MAKIDVINNCNECSNKLYNVAGCLFCSATGEQVFKDSIPDWCPLDKVDDLSDYQKLFAVMKDIGVNVDNDFGITGKLFLICEPRDFNKNNLCSEFLFDVDGAFIGMDICKQ